VIECQNILKGCEAQGRLAARLSCKRTASCAFDRIDPERRVKRASAKRGAHSGAGPPFSSYVITVKKQLNNAGCPNGRLRG
jgi:hypothetical protein